MRFREGSKESRDKGWIFFSSEISGEELQHPIFISREKTQGSLSYGRDNGRYFTAHDALCLSISLHLCDDSLPAWLADVFSCLLVDRSVCLTIHLLASRFVFQLVPVLFPASVFTPVTS